MGFRCSLLGHDYGTSEVDRDREERGDEVVVTVHEFKTCERCGTTKTVSENKEVTSIAADEELPAGTDTGDAVLIDAGEADSNDAKASSGSPTQTETNPHSTAQDGPDAGPEKVTDDSTDPSLEPSAASTDQTSTANEMAHNEESTVASQPPRDDAVILDDEEDEPTGDREYGEWPAHEQGESPSSDDQPAEWPDTDEADEGHDASPPADDADSPESLDGEGELVPGATAYPEEDAHVMTEEGGGGATTEPVTGEQTAGSGITSAGSIPSPDTASRGGTTEPLVCPECETTARSRDSLRQGDICPECKRGYLTEREHNR